MKEGFTKIKMAKRLALRLLCDHDCRVKLEQGCEAEVTDGNKIYTTRCEDFDTRDDLVWCYEIGRYIDQENITHIEHTNRFGITRFMEVDWE